MDFMLGEAKQHTLKTKFKINVENISATIEDCLTASPIEMQPQKNLNIKIYKISLKKDV